MKRPVLAALALASACGLHGCGGSNNPSSGFDNTGDGGNDHNGDAGNLFGGDTGTFGGDGAHVGPPGCSAAAQLIYVIDDQGVLHSFDPTLLPQQSAFKTVGTPNCNWGGSPAGPNSMAIDRNAVAWVCDNAGALFRVDTSTAACTSTSFQVAQNGWGKFGMGFATDQAGGTTEKLYVDDNASSIGATDSKGLGWIDLTTMKLNPIGAFDQMTGEDCELTGTGDARLFGFFFNTTSSVAEIDKATAHIKSNVNVPINVNLLGGGNIDWAFSFWGGDFYLYTADTSQAPYSDVTRYRPSDGSNTKVLSQIGFDIVGAGVSTCAPTQPVH
jgi:hypothetical protein